MREEIFKVQLSIVTNAPVRQVVFYNKDRSIWREFDAVDDLVKRLGGKLKSFWYCKVAGESVELMRPAKEQSW